jgi:hypothetical protein
MSAPQTDLNEEVNAHTLTLLFHRFLSEREWREVVEIMRTVPYVVELQMNAVVESPDVCPRCGVNFGLCGPHPKEDHLVDEDE